MSRSVSSVTVYRLDDRYEDHDMLHDYPDVTPSSMARVMRVMKKGWNLQGGEQYGFYSVQLGPYPPTEG